MTDRIEQEVALLRTYYPDLEYLADGRWILFQKYPTPSGLWDHPVVSVCFQILPGHPGQDLYGFYVSPKIKLANGQDTSNVADSKEPPFPGEWWKFSWRLEPWKPTADLKSGPNLLNFVLSFKSRLEQGV